LFEGVELTAREKADLEYKQRVYDLALERRKALEGLVDDGYSMPASYGMTILAFFILFIIYLFIIFCYCYYLLLYYRQFHRTALGCWVFLYIVNALDWGGGVVVVSVAGV
jgi:hypothetical protein